MSDAEIIRERIVSLATLSSQSEEVHRYHLTTQHAAANKLIAEWMQDSCMVTWQDAAGNQCGRIEGYAPGLPALLLGSHIDTVPNAGDYDGMLGVLLAISAVKRMALRQSELPFAIEVVAFSDEEGTRFGSALSGSRAFAGQFASEWWKLTDTAGISYREAASAFGLKPEKIHAAARIPQQLVGYLETHIEQGPELEHAGLPLGIVTAIGAAIRFQVTVTGTAGHAGATPYRLRRDALVGASELILAIESIGRRLESLATVGKITAHPGGVNVIPGRVDLSLDVRAETDEALASSLAEIKEAARMIGARRGLEIDFVETYAVNAVGCAPWLQQAVHDGIASTGQKTIPKLWSRAGHDGIALAAIADIGMMFIRCGNGGISHHPDETIEDTDIDPALEACEATILAAAAHVHKSTLEDGLFPVPAQIHKHAPVDVPSSTCVGQKATYSNCLLLGVPGDQLINPLTDCLNIPRWVSSISRQAPFFSAVELLQTASRQAGLIKATEVIDAIGSHPRLGEESGGSVDSAQFSRQEYAAILLDTDPDQLHFAEVLAQASRHYEARFGRIFLIRASGRCPEDILKELNDRLTLSDEADLETVAEELRQIALLRLRKLLGLNADPHQVSSELVIHGDRVLVDGRFKPATIRCDRGTITSVDVRDDSIVGKITHTLPAEQVLLPGLVDTHVHVNEPGRTTWEGFSSATLAAARGGVTTLIDMPLNSIPVTTTPQALAIKRNSTRGQLRVDVGFWGGVVPENLGTLSTLHKEGVFGFKAFLSPSGIDEFNALTPAELQQALVELAGLDALLIVHAESAEVLAAQDPAAGTSYDRFLASRPDLAECEAIRVLIAALKKTGARAHILHLSSARALTMIELAQQEGVNLTVETCPHYLFFRAQDIPDAATEFKCCPPIRSQDNRDQLWSALIKGTIATIGSDHSPSTIELKKQGDGDFAAAWGGISGLEVALPAVWTRAREYKMTLEKVIECMSTRPSELIGLEEKGHICSGCDADLIAFAPEEVFTVDASTLAHRHKISAFHGQTLNGVVHQTWLRGQEVHSSAAVEASSVPKGRLLRRRGEKRSIDKPTSNRQYVTP